ncbi:DUF2306 domain-containing protein [Asticcacaulis benevestitus]|uniref:DUF2306 domain-containing protein n=1 Tax=Asticcacaulis benevestitus DSM 16100 = ATCC BAA-896 TaxID=1121022 RepID=V4Q694_9CAUL|nr:DUF2306 domain-containing protein [Asticcacaulis benevestitus]ESQ93360.1 hypothetical protein ABENE_05525 [Asticcacaulis benevestitus DSM 16100 = ATCC BAA-896]
MSTHASFLSAYAHPHLPNLALIGEVSPVIQIHLLAAVAAFVIGAVQIFGPKGTGMHRILGWTWIIFMMVVAGSSFFIKIINHGSFSFIHILSGATLIAAPMIVYAARKKDIKAHRKYATRLYTGALLIAGLFTFLPGRLMWQMLFG